MNDASTKDKTERVASMLGATYTIAILCALLKAPSNYGSLRTLAGGISDATLTTRLRQLEEASIVKRTVTTGRPITVVYELTQRGRELEPIIDGIHTWATRPVKKRSVKTKTHPQSLA